LQFNYKTKTVVHKICFYHLGPFSSHKVSSAER